MSVFESIVTGLADIVRFATARPAAFDFFSTPGMATSGSYPVPRPRNPRTANPSPAQEVERIEERIRSD